MGVTVGEREGEAVVREFSWAAFELSCEALGCDPTGNLPCKRGDVERVLRHVVSSGLEDARRVEDVSDASVRFMDEPLAYVRFEEDGDYADDVERAYLSSLELRKRDGQNGQETDKS